MASRCSARCESHAASVAFGVAGELLRAVLGVGDMADAAARAEVTRRFPGADADDLSLVAELLGLATAAVASPDITPDARRRAWCGS